MGNALPALGSFILALLRILHPLLTELRRQLLFHHNLEGVISLPAGVFNPYTGVKTSILVFQKGGEFTSKGKPPRTERVWFYEVTSDGYSLGAKREPDYSRNDLWDALYKWPDKIVDSTDYFQPDLYDSRWRVVDEKLIKAFPERQDFRGVEGQELRIDELFGFNDPNPKLAEKQISEQQRPLITQLYHQRLDATEARMIAENDSRSRNVRDSFEQDLRLLDRLFREVMDRMLEDKRQWKANPTFGHDVLQPIFNEISKEAREWMKECVERVSVASNIGLFAQTAYKASEIDWQSSVNTIVREFAKLDGYDIKLRTLEVKKREEPLLETKSWSAPVRLVVRNDDWRSPDGTIQGSHDEEGRVRLEYLADPALYESEQDNIIKKEYLEDCIEAKDYNLSAGRYKPFKPITVEYEPPAKLIRELQELEGQILVRLGELLDKVEGRR